MPGFEVDPGELAAAGSRQSLLGGDMRGLGGHLEGARAGAGAAGEPDLCAAFEECLGGWRASVEELGGAVEGLAGGLAAAAREYEATDAGAMPEVG